MHRKKTRIADQIGAYLMALATLVIGTVVSSYFLQQLIDGLHGYGVPGISYELAFSFTVMFMFQLVAFFVAITGLIHIATITKGTAGKEASS